MNRPKLLLVDDTPANLLALEAALADLGQCVTANSGEEALRHLLSDDFAVILLDVRMPGMDGFETCRLIRARPRSQKTPIIFLTAEYPIDDMVARGYAEGAIDFLRKPIDVDVLRTKVGFFVSRATDRRQIEYQLEEKIAELRIANAVKDEFLCIASHELRTPLTALKLQTQKLLRSSLEPDAARRVQVINRQADRLVKLIESVLDVSRLGNGRVALELATVDLGELVSEVADRFTTEADHARCQLRVDTEPNVAGRWDRLRIDSVVSNLIANALKYGAGAPIDVLVRGTDAAAEVTVRDYGIGIDQADQLRIFGRFERAVPASDYGGFGVGLFIVREYVSAHHGEVAVQSRPQQGATFTVRLPRARS